MVSPDLRWSIVIPAYNEAHRIGKSLDAIGAYLKERAVPAEVIIINDGSTDGTGEVLAEAAENAPYLRVLSHSSNRGKGAAVRDGCLAATGRYVLFADADLAAPITEADKLWTALDSGCDVAIGSRLNKRAGQPFYRRLVGRLYHWLAGAWAVGDIQDTQCGFKAFTREAAAYLFGAQRITGIVFDTEVLFLARRAGLRIAEVPVTWSNVGGSRMQVTPGQAFRVLADLLLIRAYHRRAKTPRVQPTTIR